MLPGIRYQNKIVSVDDYSYDVFANYSGSDRKDGLISPDGNRYLIKYAEKHQSINNLDTSYVNNVVCEHLSSCILGICGYDVHHTFPATRNGELVVACENFLKPGEHLIEFGRYMRKYFDSGDVGRTPTLDQIDYVLKNDRDLSPYEKSLKMSYAERLVGDALVGNFDRHMGNFGYIVSEKGTIKPSPVYDNASTLFPNLSEHGMEDVLSSEKEILKRTLLFPKAALTVNGNKVGYYDIMASDFDSAFTAAVNNKVPEILRKLPDIFEFIERQEYLSDIRKSFYTEIIRSRADYILKPALARVMSEDYDMNAYKRLEQGMPYTEDMFERDFLKLEKKKTRYHERNKDLFNPDRSISKSKDINIEL